MVVAAGPSGDMFLHCALIARVKYIISGGRHLLHLKTYRCIKILSPAEFLSSVTS
jgi:predicted nucleic acid-binding protein